MKIPCALFVLSVLLILCTISSAKVEKIPVSGENTGKNVMHLGYWNDNFGFDRLRGKKTEKGADDYITSSFYIGGRYCKPASDILYNICLNIITNKPENYRTDILSYRILREQKMYYGTIRYGVGMILLGDYGGELIQNFYHKLASVREIDLDYFYGNEYYFNGDIEYFFQVFEINRIDMRFISQVSLSAPSAMDRLFNGAMINHSLGDFVYLRSIETQLMFGYTNRFQLPKSLSQVMKSGFSGGGRISIKIFRDVMASAWILVNQYGNNQTQVGFTFALCRNIQSYRDFTEVLIP